MHDFLHRFRLHLSLTSGGWKLTHREIRHLQAIDTLTPCPCGNNAGYARCCGPLHDGAVAQTAEMLMRSRYSAYVLKREDYLLATWHPSTRPANLKLASQQPSPT
jgi:SEC-C motif-containing protein